MGISLSGGDYQYNRFDAYERQLAEKMSPSKLQAQENEFDAFEAETGGDGDMDEEDKAAEAKQDAEICKKYPQSC